MVEQRQDRGRLRQAVLLRFEQRLKSGVARCEVVEPGRIEKLVVQPPQRRRGQVIQANVPGEDVVWGAPELGRQQAAQRIASRAGLQGEDGREHGLRVQLQPVVVDAAVQVNGEVGDAAERSVDANQLLSDALAVSQRDLAREPEVAVGPRRQEHTAIGFDAEADVAVVAHQRAWFQAEVGGVGVGGDQAEARFDGAALAHAEREDRAAADDVATVTGEQGVVAIGEIESVVACRFEPAGGRRDRMERRGRLVEKLQETVQMGHGVSRTGPRAVAIS